VVYLALVAFLPFPVRLVGAYDENPVAMIFISPLLAPLLWGVLVIVASNIAARRRPAELDI
jgi:hypothetical protein